MTDFTPLRRHASNRLSADNWGGGRSLWEEDDEGRKVVVDQLAVEVGDAPVYVRGLLGSDRVVARDRRYAVDGRPVMLATSYVAAALATNTAIAQPHIGPGGIYARLTDIGRPPSWFQEDIEFREPTGIECRRLALGADTPMVGMLTRTAFDVPGDPVEVAIMVFDLRAFQLVYEIGA
jgi:GntR family transcriptional regulator